MSSTAKVSVVPYGANYGTNLSQQYANQVGLTTGELGNDTPLCNYDPGAMTGYNTSIFSSGLGMGNGMGMGMGMTPGMGFGGCGYTPDIVNMSPEQYTAYQNRVSQYSKDQEQMYEDYQKRQIERQVKQQHLYNAAEFQASSPELNIESKVANLKRLVDENRQDAIVGSFNELVKTIKSQMEESMSVGADGKKDLSKEADAKLDAELDAKARAYALNLYTSKTGQNLVDDIGSHSDSDFVNGLKQGALFSGLYANNKTAGYNISQIANEKEAPGGKIFKWAGILISGLATVAAIPLLLKAGKSGGKFGLEKLGESFKGIFSKGEPKVADEVKALESKLKTLETNQKEYVRIQQGRDPSYDHEIDSIHRTFVDKIAELKDSISQKRTARVLDAAGI